MVTIPKKLVCKCKGYGECDACKTGRETGQRVFDSSREYDGYVAGLNSGQPECTAGQQEEYRVTWCIDVSADSPEDAVRQVWEQYFQRGHTATIFEVQQSGELDSEMIDMEFPL